MTASRISRRVLFALLTFLALPLAAQTPANQPSPTGRDASFLPPASSATDNPAVPDKTVETQKPDKKDATVDPTMKAAPVSPLGCKDDICAETVTHDESLKSTSSSKETAKAPDNNAPNTSPLPVSPPAPAVSPNITGKPVEKGTLANIDPDAIGQLAPEEGGLGAAMWKGTPRELVERLLPPLTLPNASPSLNALAQRFLLTTANVPQGTAAGRSLASMRIEKLTAIGDSADAWKLALLTKPDQTDEATLLLTAQMALLSTESKSVCAKLPEIVQNHNGPEWQKLLVVCQLRSGDTKAAQLGLDVLHTQNVKDELFFELAERNIIGGAKSLPRQLTPLKPLNLALLRLLDQPLSSEVYAHPDAALVPELLPMKARDDSPRLLLAERATARGLITGSKLAEIYGSIVFTPEQLAGAISNTEKGPRSRALYYQGALVEKEPQKRLDAAAKFVESLDGTPLNGAIAKILVDMIGPVAVGGKFFANSSIAARSFILAGKPKEALGWLKLIRENAGKVPLATTQLQDVWPVIVLSGLETDADYGHMFGPWLDTALKDADHAKREQTGTMLLLFDAAGFAVPEDAWAHVVDLSVNEKRMTLPSALLLERLRAAGIANRRGETVLLALAVAGINANESSLMPTLDTIRSLRLAGLTADALALARETASALPSPSDTAAKP